MNLPCVVADNAVKNSIKSISPFESISIVLKA